MALGQLLRRARTHDFAAFVTGSGAHIDHPITAGDHVHVVLYQDHGIAGRDKPIKLGHQLFDVGGVQAGGRLVQDVERVAAGGALQFGCQLDALGLAAG